MSKKQNQSKQVKTCTLYVDGMHCASCELLIEKTLIEQEGIESVDASLKGNKVKIQYVGKSQPDLVLINKQFNESGYTFSKTQFKNQNVPLVSIKNGTMEINPDKMNSLFRYFIIFLSFVALFFFIESLNLGRFAGVDSSSSIPAFFLLGVVAGVSSCAALIGGLLLSMTKQWNELYIGKTNKEKSQPHIMFHVGRILSFTAFGGVLGLIGEAISLSNTVVFAFITLVISVVMIVLALQMLGVQWAQAIKFTAPKSFTRYAADESNFRGKYMPFLIGILTFFLPCGFTLSAQTVALASGSPLQGALIMLAFALGTFPTLFAISYSGIAFNTKAQLTAKFNIIAGLIILFFALYNINGQLNVLGLPSLSDISRKSGTDTVIEANEEGVQELNFIAEGFEYKPVGSTTIKAGVPTVLVVDNRGIQGCGVFMAATGLIDNYVELKPGINRIDIGNPKKKSGGYKLTCTMGMVRPVTINVI